MDAACVPGVSEGAYDDAKEALKETLIPRGFASEDTEKQKKIQREAHVSGSSPISIKTALRKKTNGETRSHSLKTTTGDSQAS